MGVSYIYLTLFLCLSVACAEKFRFDNYTLYKTYPQNEAHIKLLQDLEHDFSFDFWNDPIPNIAFVDIMANPSNKGVLENLLNTNGVGFEIAIQNIQDAIDKETVSSYTRTTTNMNWNTYYPLQDIEAWMSDMAAAFPRVATQIVGGRTYEGRTITGLKLSHGSGRKIIFVEAGIHAREWIAPTVGCYIINELLTSNDQETMAAARDFDWYIFPVTNPDGYVWSHEEFRLWRKNRRNVNGTTFGVDLNRNWDSNFMLAGVSLDPAAQTYPGLVPFSEPESRTLATFIRSLSHDIEMYLSFHSSGQLLLVPYGNTSEPLDNYDDAVNIIGRRAMGALRVRYDTQYTTGNIYEAIYPATGTSIDWVKEELRVPLVYCYELRDRGTYGHLLPPDQILPTNLETMDSILELIHQAKRFGFLEYPNSGFGVKAPIILVFLSLYFKLLV